MCYFNLPDFSHTIQNQLDDIHHVIDKFSQMPGLSHWFSWFHWIWPILIGLFLLCVCLPVLLMWVHHFITSLLKPIHAYAIFPEIMPKE